MTTDSWKNEKGTGNSVTWIFYGVLKNKNQMASCYVYEMVSLIRKILALTEPFH